jgi:hypothetical protein
MGPLQAAQPKEIARQEHFYVQGETILWRQKHTVPFRQRKKQFARSRAPPNLHASSLNGSGPSSNGSHKSVGHQHKANTSAEDKTLDERILSGEVR